MKSKLLILALASGIAATTANAKEAKCLLAFEGEIYMNGPCTFDAESDGSFWITTSDGMWSASLTVGHDGDPQYAYGVWNSDEPDENGRYVPANRLHGILGELKRNGACWSNRDAVVCAW